MAGAANTEDALAPPVVRTDFTAVAILVEVLTRIRLSGTEVAASAASTGAHQVPTRAGLTRTRAVDAG